MGQKLSVSSKILLQHRMELKKILLLLMLPPFSFILKIVQTENIFPFLCSLENDSV